MAFNKAAGVKQEEELMSCSIPENFVDTGRIFHGMFRTRNLIEGVIFVLPIFFALLNVEMDLQPKIVVMVIVCGGMLGGFIAGINGNSVGEFLSLVFKYNQRKRVAKYNPRVKNEASPGYLTKEQNELPRDKIIRLIEQFRESQNKGDEDAVSRDIYDPIYIEFFEDDVGVIELPDDLKTKGELRKEAKERKRNEKQKRREAAQEAKQLAKEDRKSGKPKNKPAKPDREKPAKKKDNTNVYRKGDR